MTLTILNNVSKWRILKIPPAIPERIQVINEDFKFIICIDFIYFGHCVAPQAQAAAIVASTKT
jgi:hypothetical protein